MRYIFTGLAIFLIASCSSANTSNTTSYPLSTKDAIKVRNGSLSGSDEGISLFGGNKDKDDKKNSGIGVNSFLWRAALDTISFMPITSADPFGGVILTDWYEDPAVQNTGLRERFKINVTILDDRLRADGVRVSLFRQNYDAKTGWRDEVVSKDAEREIENTILTRARELRVKQTGK